MITNAHNTLSLFFLFWTATWWCIYYGTETMFRLVLFELSESG
jgi:hypothetical protein